MAKLKDVSYWHPGRQPAGLLAAPGALPDERAEALEHLDFAIGELRDMKMQPSLERAPSHRDILKA